MGFPKKYDASLEGFKAQVKSDELRAHFKDRAGHHAARAKHHSTQAQKLRAELTAVNAAGQWVGEDDDDQNEGRNFSNATVAIADPRQNALRLHKNHAKGHEKKEIYFGFLTEHVPAEQEFYFGINELEELEFFEARRRKEDDVVVGSDGQVKG